jgi:hypothetical protein
MDRSAAVRDHLGGEWIPSIYESKVRSQRTRSYKLDVPVRENTAEIQYTLLGIELKIGKRRFACPDLATARYLRIFARLGSTDFAVPYDITKISVIADELETAWHKTLLMIDAETGDLSAAGRKRYRNAILRSIRDEIGGIGSGPAMPEFSRETRQRKL